MRLNKQLKSDTPFNEIVQDNKLIIFAAFLLSVLFFVVLVFYMQSFTKKEEQPYIDTAVASISSEAVAADSNWIYLDYFSEKKITSSAHKNQNIINKNKYILNCGAFKNFENAKRLHKHLSGFGFKLVIKEVKEEIFWLVLHDSGSSKREMDILKGKIEKEKYFDCKLSVIKK